MFLLLFSVVAQILRFSRLRSCVFEHRIGLTSAPALPTITAGSGVVVIIVFAPFSLAIAAQAAEQHAGQFD